MSVKTIQSFAKVCVMPGKVFNITFEGHEITAAKAIELAGLSATGFDVRVGDTVVTDLEAQMVADRGLVTMVKKIKGG